jgi:hypothetical protein
LSPGNHQELRIVFALQAKRTRRNRSLCRTHT